MLSGWIVQPPGYHTVTTDAGFENQFEKLETW